MSEKLNDAQNERIENTPEISQEHYERAAEAVENKAEKGVENGEKQAERAKNEALEQAISVESGSAERKKRETSAAPKKKHRNISRKEKDASFDRHMTSVRTHMTAPERTFSKFIHAKPVEATSEFVGSTIARPNAILAGAMVAFFAVLGVYLTAKYLGYPLSGFETIGAFIVGWILGILYDFFKVMITGKK